MTDNLIDRIRRLELMIRELSRKRSGSGGGSYFTSEHTGQLRSTEHSRWVTMWRGRIELDADTVTITCSTMADPDATAHIRVLLDDHERWMQQVRPGYTDKVESPELSHPSKPLDDGLTLTLQARVTEGDGTVAAALAGIRSHLNRVIPDEDEPQPPDDEQASPS